MAFVFTVREVPGICVGSVLRGGWMGMVGRVEEVACIVGDEIEAHEEKEDGHGETDEDFASLKPEGMPDTAAFPDLEVGENVYGGAEESADGVVKN